MLLVNAVGSASYLSSVCTNHGQKRFLKYVFRGIKKKNTLRVALDDGLYTVCNL